MIRMVLVGGSGALSSASLTSPSIVSPPPLPRPTIPLPSPSPDLTPSARPSTPLPSTPPPPKVVEKADARAKLESDDQSGAPAVSHRLGGAVVGKVGAVAKLDPNPRSASTTLPPLPREVGLEAVDVDAEPDANQRSTPPTASATSHPFRRRVDVPAKRAATNLPGTPTQLAPSSTIDELASPIALNMSAKGNSMDRMKVTKMGSPSLGSHTPTASARRKEGGRTQNRAGAQGEVADQCVASCSIGDCTVANRIPPPPLGRSVAVITRAPRRCPQLPTAAVATTGELPRHARIPRPPRVGVHSIFTIPVNGHLATSFGHDVIPHPDIRPRRALAARAPVPPGSPGEFIGIVAGARGSMQIRPLALTSHAPRSGEHEDESQVEVRPYTMHPVLRPLARPRLLLWQTRRPRRRRRRPSRRPWPFWI